MRGKVVLLLSVSAVVLYFTAAGWWQAYLALWLGILAAYVWAAGVMRQERRIRHGRHSAKGWSGRPQAGGDQTRITPSPITTRTVSVLGSGREGSAGAGWQSND